MSLNYFPKINPVAQMYCYTDIPLDYWEGLYSVSETLTNIAKQEVHNRRFLMNLVEFLMLCANKHRGWEGDIQHFSDGHESFYEDSAYLFCIPNPSKNCTEFGLIWKQHNNGTTFICSPVELPHLGTADYK